MLHKSVSGDGLIERETIPMLNTPRSLRLEALILVNLCGWGAGGIKGGGVKLGEGCWVLNN